MSNLVEISGVKKGYGISKTVFEDLNLVLPEGKIIGLLGPNGSGKTTLIKMLVGLLQPEKGSIRICGHEVGPESKAVVSYLPERTYFNEYLKIRQLVNMFKDFYADFDEARAYDMMQLLNIDPDMTLKKLSKGNKEKVQLIMVMSRRARLYVLDEPTTGLHFADVHKLVEILQKLTDGGNTVLVIEHNLDVIKAADYIIDIGPEGGEKGGTVIAQGTPEEVAENQASYTGIYVKKMLERDK